MTTALVLIDLQNDYFPGGAMELVGSDEAKRRTAALFAQGLQTRGPLELDLGDRMGAL